jgi:hypothetical protein
MRRMFKGFGRFKSFLTKIGVMFIILSLLVSPGIAQDEKTKTEQQVTGQEVKEGRLWTLSDEEVQKMLEWAKEDRMADTPPRLFLWRKEFFATYDIMTPAFALYWIARFRYKEGRSLSKEEIASINEEWSREFKIWVSVCGNKKGFAQKYCDLTIYCKKRLKDETEEEVEEISPVNKEIIEESANYPNFPPYKALLCFTFPTEKIPRDAEIRLVLSVPDYGEFLSDVDLSKIP